MDVCRTTKKDMFKINIEFTELDINLVNFKMVSTSNYIIASHNIRLQKEELLDKFFATLKHQDNFTTKRRCIF